MEYVLCGVAHSILGTISVFKPTSSRTTIDLSSWPILLVYKNKLNDKFFTIFGQCFKFFDHYILCLKPMLYWILNHRPNSRLCQAVQLFLYFSIRNLTSAVVSAWVFYLACYVCQRKYSVNCNVFNFMVLKKKTLRMKTMCLIQPFITHFYIHQDCNWQIETKNCFLWWALEKSLVTGLLLFPE